MEEHAVCERFLWREKAHLLSDNLQRILTAVGREAIMARYVHAVNKYTLTNGHAISLFTKRCPFERLQYYKEFHDEFVDTLVLASICE